MTAQRPGTPEPPFTGAVSLQALLSDQLPVRDVGTNLDEIRASRRLVVLDDDPTGTQCIADLPVLTRWEVPDLRWALQQPTTGFFVLTNTRSLSEAEDFEAQGLFDAGCAELIRANLRAADSLPEAVADADLIEEAVLEQPEVKVPVLEDIEAAARPEAIIGSNTSTIPIGDLTDRKSVV